MPTYQYRCQQCDELTEAVQKFSDDPLTECPHCGGHLRKVFSPVGIVFKGSGFYATDSRSKGKSEAARPGHASEPHGSGAGNAAENKGGESKADAGSSAGGKNSTSAPAPAKDSSTSSAAQPSSTGGSTTP